MLILDLKERVSGKIFITLLFRECEKKTVGTECWAGRESGET